ncbi:MAG: HAD family hydrolase [Pseudomonadota bacterium]|jgi:HAD superfamily hydrolase (TIGR01509 family)
MKRVEWVLFDLGGVLVEVEQSRIFEGLAAKTGIDTKTVGQALLTGSPLQTEFIVREYLPSRLTSEVNRVLGTSLSEGEVVAAVNAELGKTIETTAQLLPDLRSRVKIGCLSNTNSVHWDHLLKAYDFMGLFDRRFASQMLGYAKPGKEIYTTVVEHLGVAPQQILFFDDKLENVETALKLGWHARIYQDHQGLLAHLDEFGLLGTKG